MLKSYQPLQALGNCCLTPQDIAIVADFAVDTIDLVAVGSLGIFLAKPS